VGGNARNMTVSTVKVCAQLRSEGKILQNIWGKEAVGIGAKRRSEEMKREDIDTKVQEVESKR